MNSSTETTVKREPKTRFRFDEAFDALAQATGRDGRPQIYTAGDLARARSEARAEGHAEGRAGMARETEHMVAKALAAIAARIDSLNATQKRVLAAVNRDSIELAVTTAQKLALGLTRLRPLDEIECSIAECLEKIALEPRVVIRVHPDIIEPLNGKLEELTRRAGFEGRIVLLGEPAMAADSCQIDWADGGTERSSETVVQTIDGTIQRLLSTGLEPDESGSPDDAAPPPPADSNH